MSDFSSGVKRYIKAQAVVEVGFPVDWRDNAEIACKHCQFYVRATQRCGLNQQVVNFPERYVGTDCPLEPIEEMEEKKDV
jgi:hypothetical protein